MSTNLPVLASGLFGHVGEELEIPLAVDAALAALAGTAAKLLANEPADGHEARVGAPQRRVRSRVGAGVARS